MKTSWLRPIGPGLCALVLLPIAGGLSLDPGEPFSAVTDRVRLTSEHEAPGNNWLRAFVATDSDDPRIHATVNECGAHQTAARGRLPDYGLPYLVSGGIREVAGRKGILVTVWFNGPPAPDVEVWVTVTQPGAKSFGKPIPYRVDESRAR